MVLGSYSLCFLSGCGLWFSLWLKCSGCGLWSCFLYFWSCSLCFVRRCWSLSGCGLWSCFLYFWSCFFVFIRLLYVVLFPLLCQAVLVFVWCFCLVGWGLVEPFRLWSLFWSCFCLIFGYGYAVAEALRLWFFVLFLLSLLGGVVAWLRTRLLFVYFFISSFVCFFYLFLRCFSGLCLLSLSGGSGRTTCFFFVRSRFV